MIGGIVKYGLWIVSTALTVAGAWLFDFTKADPANPDRRLLTRAGRIALPFSILGFVLSLTLEIHDTCDRSRAAARAEAERKELVRDLSTANAEVARLAHPLRPLRFIAFIHYDDVLTYWPRYGGRIATALRAHRLPRSAEQLAEFLLPRPGEEAEELRNSSIQLIFKHPAKGRAMFDVETSLASDEARTLYLATGWKTNNALEAVWEDGKLRIIREIWAPATLFRNDPTLTSAADLVDAHAGVTISMTFFHSPGAAKHFRLSGNEVSVALPGRERYIRIDPASCNSSVAIGDRTTLTCKEYEITPKPK